MIHLNLFDEHLNPEIEHRVMVIQKSK